MPSAERAICSVGRFRVSDKPGWKILAVGGFVFSAFAVWAAGKDYVLHAGNGSRPGWLARLLHKAPPEFTFRLPDRDEAGAQALSALVGPVFDKIAGSMVDAFVKRADQVYGSV